MAWHTNDWMKFFVNLFRFVFSLFQAEEEAEERNGGGWMMSMRDGAKDVDSSPPGGAKA